MYTVEGKLVRWAAAPDSRVTTGQIVAEVETEKATYELEAPADGLLHPVAAVGTVLPIEGLLGYILAEGEAPPLARPSASVAAPPGGASAEAAGMRPDGAAEPRATPIARRLAAEHKVDLRRLTGSGPGGRIVEADVLAAVAAPAAPGGAEVAVRERIPLTGMRGAVAERVRRSLATAASLTLTREVRAASLAQARKRATASLGLEVSYDAWFVKLLAAALREHPIFNSTVEHDTIVVLDEVHVGFAVALPLGLIVPVVRHADREPLRSIAGTVHELATRAKGGHLRPQDVTGGTASISNLGAHGIDAFTPILNPPQSAILGIGRIARRPVVDGERIGVSETCVLSLTFDHRVADGAPAAELLHSIAQKMEDERYLDALST